MEVGAFDRDVEDSFKKATEFVSIAKFKASNDDKLKLYGYFKQATVGPCNVPKPGFLYFEEKAKWDKWNSLGTMNKDEAMEQYVKTLTALVPDWQSSDYKPASGSDSGGSGMKAVSRMQQEEEGTSEVWDWVRKGDLFKLKECLDKGVNIDAKDEEGRTPLHWAADGGHLAIATELLTRSASVNNQDNEGQTPLHYACSCEQEDLIALLLKHKADVNIKDKSGESPLDINASIIESMMNSL
eukprot:TRINITY_DN5591_c0_g1_i1.p1 TRINITY_DN5591_c0_g1~~TRINITY_DN5591_c0_g1_i1.p1  ORF type:complete len:241 (+),score=66.70 TRINITY_DN5591_c0_g1_i1:72-794(+)